MTLYRNPGD